MDNRLETQKTDGIDSTIDILAASNSEIHTVAFFDFF